ncbi:hypothetical protein DP939_22370 [Spongiactinospora rosea]|uniref:Uncharacterized protein n=1 Tax=Spongiactinospora rosea TaxID=2248750 RepID=A0A366LVY0_9ACTN|nr:hypothetical protein DP939_22370 [Spongiactinospora rosea]
MGGNELLIRLIDQMRSASGATAGYPDSVFLDLILEDAQQFDVTSELHFALQEALQGGSA